MFGVSESKEPVKGEFAKKIIKEVAKIREQKMKKDYLSNEKFDEEVNKAVHNILQKDDIQRLLDSGFISLKKMLNETMDTTQKDTFG